MCDTQQQLKDLRKALAVCIERGNTVAAEQLTSLITAIEAEASEGQKTQQPNETPPSAPSERPSGSAAMRGTRFPRTSFPI